MENVFIMDHPLIQHKISMLRNKNTGTNEFRKLLDHSDSIYRRSSSCEHRIRHNDLSLFDPIRQLTEIFMRFMGLRMYRSMWDIWTVS